jgi:hypothetical protein
MISGFAGSRSISAEPGHADVDAAVEGLPVAPMRQLEKLVPPQ